MTHLSCDYALVEKALSDMRAAWDASGAGWRDQARHDFAHDHLEPIELHARQAAEAMRRLDSLLRDAVRQCL